MNTSAKCDFCNSSLHSPIYNPSGTRKGAAIHVCNTCGLVQSCYRNIQVERIKTLSTDADWGNVRHGKGVRQPYLLALLRPHCDASKLHNVLDIGSNRGDFLAWILENSDAQVTALEPDDTLVDTYPVSRRVRLIADRFENAVLEPASFDLVFCSHTLEHVNSASKFLTRCKELLTDNGLFLLEVPNIQAISLENYVEEFFIDKHTFHFDRSTLIEYCEHIGFSIVSGLASDDPMNISLLLCKSLGSKRSAFHDRQEAFRHNSALLANFKHKLEERRSLVKKACEAMLIPLCLRQKVGFWGAGRIFDTLCKYGGLKAEHVHCLVDGYLWKVAPMTHGLRVERPEALKIYEPQVVVILGNSSEIEMSERAYAMGVRHVIKFSELIEQVS